MAAAELVVPPGRTPRSGQVVGDSSVKALEYALSLAQEADATLTLLHVLEALPDESVIPFDIPEYRRQREDDALRRLRAERRMGQDDLVRAGVSHRETVFRRLHGGVEPPGRTIVSEAFP